MNTTLDNEELNLNYFNKIKANNLLFYTEKKYSDHPLKVYPYHDEAEDMLNASNALSEKFDYVIDCFCGGGHTILPILKRQIAQKGIGFDINPRSIRIAHKNMELNNLEGKVEFYVQDINDGIPTSPNKTLFIANPPFAINAKSIFEKHITTKYHIPPLRKYRDGGETGLELTEKFLTEVKKVFKKGDKIIGLTYSRISKDNKIEVDSLLKKIFGYGFEYKINLLQHRKIWRGFNKMKNEENPMPIEKIISKANPESEVELKIYKNAIKYMKKENWSKIGYFCYIIT